MAKTTEPRFVARRAFGYGDLDLDRGQVFTLAGLRNDERLLRLGYAAELPPGAQTHTCAEDGAEFVGLAELTAHGDRRHRPRSTDPADEDAAEEREERIAEATAPLYLDQTLGAAATA